MSDHFIPSLAKQQRSYRRGCAPRTIFLVDGKSYTIAECCAKTGMTPDEFRLKYRSIRVSKRATTWREITAC